jgi:hypothetical protein
LKSLPILHIYYKKIKEQNAKTSGNTKKLDVEIEKKTLIAPHGPRIMANNCQHPEPTQVSLNIFKGSSSR